MAGYRDFIAPAFLLFWIAGAIWRGLCFARDAANIEKLRRESVRLSHARFGLPDNVDIRLHANLRSPLATGLFRPSIILPTAMVEENGEAVRCALAHERAHVERGDLAANFAENVVLCLFWWNPSLHLIRNAIAENREMACDDRAVIQTENTSGYASALVACAEHAMTPELTASVSTPSLGLIGKTSRFTRRIARLAERSYRPQTRTAKSQLLLAGAAIMVTTACAAAASPRLEVNSGVASSPYAQAAAHSKSERLGRALVEAIIDDDIARAENLLADGADINAVLEGDGTPLIAAISHDCFGFAWWLIDNGADVNLSAKTETGKLRSPLGEARKHGRRKIAQLLIQSGAVQ